MVAPTKSTWAAPGAVFVAQVRVEAAKRVLADSDASMAEIARDCGFGTETTFRRTFRRLIGVSPSDWRARFSRCGRDGDEVELS